MLKHKGRDCPPPPENPADQPTPPGDGRGCQDLPTTEIPKPPDVPPCPGPDPCCKCPSDPGSGTTCLENLIAQQTADTAALQQETLLTQDLNKLLETTKKGLQAYTRDKYDDLIEKWQKEDIEIAELVRKLACAVPC